MSVAPVKVGVVGCGAISKAYFSAQKVFGILDFVACADLVPEKARAKAEEHDIPSVLSVDELLASPEVEVVLNLTVPQAHAEINDRALKSGKHVYVEKPLAVTRAAGRKTLLLAEKRGLRVGCAPDTFLGDGGQTCRRLVDSGAIGAPLGATAFMMGHGHESWHPSPEFYYEVGGGPLFDMGPYYLTALVNLLGPVTRVAATSRVSFPTRTITSEPKKGKVVPVKTPTHILGLLEFRDGVTANLAMSFDVWAHRHSCLEIYGTEGSLIVPDPNGFAGQILLAKPGQDWQEMPHTTGHPEYQRGAGLADMCYGIRTGRPHRVNGQLAGHVLDIMASLLESGDRGAFRTLRSTTERPAAVPAGLAEGTFEA